MRASTTITSRVALAFLLGGAMVGGGGHAQQQAPWVERADLSLEGMTSAPTTAERLAQATVLIVADFDVLPDPFNPQWLDVDPWTTWQGHQADPPLCDPSDPFYGQPTTARTPTGSCANQTGQCIRGCTGFLVGPDLLVTAGHCISPPPGMDPWETKAPYPCYHRYVILDYSDLGPVGPNDEVPIQPEQVVECLQVEVDTFGGNDEELGSVPFGAGRLGARFGWQKKSTGYRSCSSDSRRRRWATELSCWATRLAFR